MSLFETFSAMSKQHAENSGSYTFEKPAEPEPAPTVSLYNLLDQSEFYLTIAATSLTYEAERHKEDLPVVSEALYAWATLFKAAIREKKDREGEAWAEKTAKEINETTK